jgi:hypothetical protein
MGNTRRVNARARQGRPVKRLVGVLVAIAPLGVVGWSLVDDSRLAGVRLALLGYLLAALGATICALNFYLSALRVPMTRRFTGREPAQRVSGAPLLGAFAWIGLALAPPSTALSLVTLLLILCDTGGVSWFVVATWRDQGFWG